VEAGVNDHGTIVPLPPVVPIKSTSTDIPAVPSMARPAIHC
jgi:hypothetical protein